MTAQQEPGPLAEEAAALVEAALGWAQRAASVIGSDAETCTSCPLCRAVGALREPSPELSERLTATVTDLAALFAAGLRAASDARHRPHRHEPGEQPDEAHTGHGGGVEHIDIA